MMSRFPSLDSALVQRMGVRVTATKRAAVVAVLAAIGTVAWAGCGSSNDDRYYCDNAGCYQCDAYCCSTVTPPAKQACTGAASCAAGSVCTATGCTTTCSDSIPCAKGEVCKGGLCSAPAVDPGAKKDCTTKADCGDGKACMWRHGGPLPVHHGHRRDRLRERPGVRRRLVHFAGQHVQILERV